MIRDIKTKEGITRIYVYSMLTLFLFFTGFSGYSSIFTSKCVVFTALSLLYIILSFVFGISSNKMSVSQISALVYLGITALSAIVSPHLPHTLAGVSRYEGLLTVGLYVTVFIIVSQNWQADKHFPLFISVVMLVQSAIVLLQLLGVNILWLYPKGTNYYIALEKYNGAFISTIGNADIASAFFSLMTPILWGFFATSEKHRPLTLLSAVASLLCLVFMSVSAGIVAIVTLLAVLPIVLFPKKRKTVILLLLLFAVTVLVAVYFLPLGDGVLFELHSLLHGDFDPDFGSGRLHIWREVLDKLHPLLGTGPDTMLREGIEPFVKTVDGNELVRRIDIAHNDYLNILFHQGIFALIAYLGILIPLFIKWLKHGSTNKTALVMGAGAFAYSVQVFFSYSACSSAVFFWIILGMLSSALQSNTTSCAEQNSQTPHNASKPLG